MKLEFGNKGIITFVLQNGQRVYLLGKKALKGEIYTQCPLQTSLEMTENIHCLLRSNTLKRLVMNVISSEQTQLKYDDKPCIYQINTEEKAKGLEPSQIQFVCSIGQEKKLPRADIIVGNRELYALSVFSRTALVFVMSSLDDNNKNTAMGVLIRPAILKHFQAILDDLVRIIGGDRFLFSVLSYSGFNYPDGNNVMPAIKNGIEKFCRENNVQIIPDYNGFDASIPNKMYYTVDDTVGNNIFFIP